MDLDTHGSVHDEAVVLWLEDSIEHARAQNQGKLLGYLECVSNELAEMRRETRLTASSS